VFIEVCEAAAQLTEAALVDRDVLGSTRIVMWLCCQEQRSPKTSRSRTPEHLSCQPCPLVRFLAGKRNIAGAPVDGRERFPILSEMLIVFSPVARGSLSRTQARRPLLH
jgi:hypothetical protein